MFRTEERQYVERARVGRLATADAEGRPHAVPVCFALMDDSIVTPIDEKPQRAPPEGLRRAQNVRTNDRVCLVVDHYTEEWDRLGWVQVRGTATIKSPEDDGHADGIRALRAKYDQYATHALDDRPLIRIEVGSVQSWGSLVT
ncbi:TIGR03668 family PPOX class F420-dependent oxidoreductase [Halovenus marina]|uniref:TIGR03668 family PPOX class F420-dependent oxidoreductase n=1 Tax=Halovenus marina TaxID=3396621 RepID=UPI003F571C4A